MTHFYHVIQGNMDYSESYAKMCIDRMFASHFHHNERLLNACEQSFIVGLTLWKCV